MRLIVTRPREDAVALATRLAELGHEAMLEPLLEVVLEPPRGLSLTGVQALIATSRNAIAAVAMAPSTLARARSLPLYCVGTATAVAASGAGFGQVRAGPGTGAELVEVIRRELDPAGGTLLHLAGETLAVDVAGLLAAHGFHASLEVTYRTEPARRLSDATLAAVRSGAVDGVILLSPRTAATWTSLVLTHGLAGDARGLKHLVISEASAKRLAPLAPARVLWPARPNMECLLALVACAAEL